MNNQFFSSTKFILAVVGSVFILFNFFEFWFFKSTVTNFNNILETHSASLRDLETKVSSLEKTGGQNLMKLEYSLLDEKGKRVFSGLDLEQKVSEVEGGNATNIINQWGSYVVYVECDFSNTETGEVTSISNGSGLLTQESNLSVLVLTNKHVVSESEKITKECRVVFPKDNLFIRSSEVLVVNDDLDWGIIRIDLEDPFLDKLMETPPYICSKQPELGDKVVILGYPTIGDEYNVTATEGIISGFDNNYFITSAKVEQGNSGGAAISLKNNCYLGTPTFSKKGELESLARILDVSVLMK
ncbi:MAG: serine protease [Patescibacteria group bacterium]